MMTNLGWVCCTALLVAMPALGQTYCQGVKLTHSPSTIPTCCCPCVCIPTPSPPQRIKEQDNHGIAVWVKELSGPGRVAVLLVNHGNRVQDFALMFQKHLPDLHARWARTLHNPPPPPCLDRKPECVGWAASGECERNPGGCGTDE
jgi:hypothetical protein